MNSILSTVAIFMVTLQVAILAMVVRLYGSLGPLAERLSGLEQWALQKGYKK